MATEWYRNKTWNAAIETEFEARLKRCRGTYSKAQNLKIQGLELLEVAKKALQKKGVVLLNRVIEEYKMEEGEVANANEALGDYYLETCEYEKAESYFRLVVKYGKKNGRNGTSWIADIKLAEVIYKSNQTAKFTEAYKYILKFPKRELKSLLNSEKFKYYELGALLGEALETKEEAKAFALQALNLSKITEPDFSRHPTIGLIKTTKSQIAKLKKILS